MSQRFGIFFVRLEREDPRSQTRSQRTIETESRTHVVEHSSEHQSVHQNLLNSQLVIPLPGVHFPARIYLKYQPYPGPPAHPQAALFPRRNEKIAQISHRLARQWTLVEFSQ